MYPNVTAGMALQYHDIFITAVRTVNQGVVDIKENHSSERLKIDTVPLVQCKGDGTDGLHTMLEENEVEKKGIIIPTQVCWLVNHCTIRGSRLNVEIATSSAAFVVKGIKVVHSLVKKGIEVAGVWYQVKTYTNVGPDSGRKLC